MKRGPKPQPTHLRLLRGNPGKRPVNPDEPEPELCRTCPDAPDFLNAYATDEWYRVAEELHRLKLLTVVDLGPLAAYCYMYAQWRQASEALQKLADNDPVTHGMLVKRDNNLAQNPLVVVARRAAADMVRYASEFGFTPAARTRIRLGESALET